LNSKWLTALAEGKAIGTVAVVESAGSIEPVDIATVAAKDGAGWRLSGVKMLVPYANVADFIVVAAKNNAGEIALFVVDTKSAGVKIRALKNLDLTRRVSRVELKNAPAELLSGGAGLFAKLIDVAAVAIAADSLGGTERALEMAVEYSKIREQFGKPIGIVPGAEACGGRNRRRPRARASPGLVCGSSCGGKFLARGLDGEGAALRYL